MLAAKTGAAQRTAATQASDFMPPSLADETGRERGMCGARSLVLRSVTSQKIHECPYQAARAAPQCDRDGRDPERANYFCNPCAFFTRLMNSARWPFSSSSFREPSGEGCLFLTT